jgi:hypothetical protein
LARVYFPQAFRNADVQNLISALTLWMGHRPDWFFDEGGFWVEVDDDDVDKCEEVVSAYLVGQV